METRQAARNQDEERKHTAVAPQPPPPRQSCRKTGRDDEPTRPTRRRTRRETKRADERQAGHRPHAPHGRDENAIAPPAANPTGKQTDGTPQRKHHEPAIDIGPAHRIESSKQDANAPRPTPRLSFRRAGRRKDRQAIDEMTKARRNETSREERERATTDTA